MVVACRFSVCLLCLDLIIGNVVVLEVFKILQVELHDVSSVAINPTKIKYFVQDV